MKVTVIDTIKKKPFELKRVAGYARVSIDRAETEKSLKAQTEYLRKKISSNRSWADCGVFLDLGISGTRTNRPGFQALMAKCESREVDLILTKSISRFCRNTVDLLSTTRHLKDLGVEVWFDENNLSTFSIEGELILSILASQAQEESRSISENVLWTFRKKFENGEGLPHDLLGYRWNGAAYSIVEKEAELVRRIYSLYLSGLGPKRIASLLRSEGCKGLHGAELDEPGVAYILRQEKYSGDSILQKTFTENHITHKEKINHGEKDRFYVEGTHPSIIDKETFEKVQIEIKRRSELDSLDSNWSLKTSVFTSRIICKNCGRSFRRKTLYGKNGYRYHLWVCGNRIDKRDCKCTSKAIPEWTLLEMTSAVLGKEEYSEEEFTARIDHIEGGEDHKATFVMMDGSRKTFSWKNRKGGRKDDK